MYSVAIRLTRAFSRLKSESQFCTKFVALIAAGALFSSGCKTGNDAAAGQTNMPHEEHSTRRIVGRIATNCYYTPANQILTPAGVQVPLPGMRPQAIALSPNGRLLVTAGKTHELVVLDPVSGKVLQRVPLPSDKDTDPAPTPVSEQILEPDMEGQLSFTGLEFSPDGMRIYLSNVQGSVKVLGLKADGSVEGLFSISLPAADAPRRRTEIPAGLAISRDGKRLYVALNLSNRMAELDASNGKVLRIWDVGVVPYGVALAGNKAYVSNWGGRRPETNVTGPAGRGMTVRVDPVRHIASEGSVSVIDLSVGGQTAEKEVVSPSKSRRRRTGSSETAKKQTADLQ